MATQGSQQEVRLQGAGSWSDRNYVNGADLQSDNTYWNRQVSGGGGRWDDAMPMSGGQRYADVYGGDEVLNAADKLTMSNNRGINPNDAAIISTLQSRQINQMQRNLAELNALSAQISTDQQLGNMQAMANAYRNAGLRGATGDPLDGIYPIETSAPLTGAQRAALAAGYGPLTPEVAASGVAKAGYQLAPVGGGMSNDQAYALYMTSGGRSVGYVTPAAGWSYGDVNYDLIGSVAGGAGAVSSAFENTAAAVGKTSAISILGRAAPLHAERMAQISKSAELSSAMTAVSSTSKSGQAMLRVAGATKALGPLGFAASVTEIAADVTAAPANQKIETFASSSTSAAVGGVAVLGAAGLGAKFGFAVTLGNPIGGVIGGGLFGIGAALGYEFGGGSNAVKSSVKDSLLELNDKKR